MLLDRYIICVAVYSLFVLIFRAGMIYQKHGSMTKKQEYIEIVKIVPYFFAVLFGGVILFSKEVVL